MMSEPLEEPASGGSGEDFATIKTAFAPYITEPRWITWKFIGTKKVPLSKNGNNAVGDLISHGATLQEVIDRIAKDPTLHPGFVLSKSQTSIGGIDIDGCYDPVTKTIAPWALPWITRLDSYSEISPSRTGIKIYVQAPQTLLKQHTKSVPTESISGKNPQFEIYNDGRYFAVTGWHLTGTPMGILERPEPWREMSDFVAEGNSRTRVARQKEYAGVDDAIFREGCRMQQSGASDEAIEAFIRTEVNNFRSKLHENFKDKGRMERDPYGERDIQRLFRSITKYPKGPGSSQRLILNPKDFPGIARSLLLTFWTNQDSKTLLVCWQEEFYEWQRNKYVSISESMIKARIWSYLESAKCYNKDGKTLQDFNPNTGHVVNVYNALAAATCIPDGTVMPHWFNRPKDAPEATDLIACKNGLLDPATGELFAHTPDYFNLIAADVEYDPDALCPRWEEFLCDVWPGDPESIAFLREWFGYMLTYDTSQQKVFLMVAPKRGGKGTINSVLINLLGRENTCSPTSGTIGQNFGMQALIGKSLATVPDARFDKRTITSLSERLLSISGGDSLNIPRKYLNDWEGRLTVRFMLWSNLPPEFDDPSGVIASRFIALKGTQSWYDREDHELEAKLLGELPGILNWAIFGLQRLRARGRFVQPESGKALIEQMEQAASPILSFINERCVKAGWIACDQLFLAWRSWCEANDMGGRTGTRASFGMLLSTVLPGVQRRRAAVAGDRVYIYDGISLMAEEGNDGPPIGTEF